MKSALHTRPTCSTNARPQEERPSMTEPGNSLRVEESASPGIGYCQRSFDIGSFELVRRFVEHLVAKNAPARLGDGQPARHMFDWNAVEASVTGSRTLEQAIGRAVVMADQMSRVVRDGTQRGDSPPSLKIEDSFFEFSMADVIPDFGDESRYRTRVARKVTSIFGTRRTAVPMNASSLLTLSTGRRNPIAPPRWPPTPTGCKGIG